MKRLILVFCLSFLLFSCQKQTISERSIEIVKLIQNGNVDGLRKQFYSQKAFDKIPNFEKGITNYKLIIEDEEIDKKENVIIESKFGSYEDEFTKKDSVEIIICTVPVGLEVSSSVPKYFVELNYFVENESFNLIGFNLISSQNKTEYVDLELKESIEISKRDIIDVNFMYEGGYKNPMIFKRNELLKTELGVYKKPFDTLLQLINNSKIVDSKKEGDTRRFNGDPELGVITMDLYNNHVWTVFSIFSEENNKPENFKGDLELRYYKYLNLAVTYWIEVEDKDLLKKVIDELCHSGENKRTKPRESVKLENSDN